MVKVDSSSIDSVVYVKRTHNLYVNMKDKTSIVYHDVPEEEYQALMDADSIGRYYNYYIRSNYPFDYL